jgi:undecaprenyl-diphosphatase
LIVEALILGIVQGVTEFLPVSSTAHLILFPWFFDWSGEVDTLTFDVALHGGTLLALLLCFWKDWIDLLLRKRRLLWLILVASVPAGAAGYLLNDFAENHLRNPVLISVMLIGIGFVMLAAERMSKYRKMGEADIRDALIIGIAQMMSIIPGVSRSGITISAGLFRGFEREAAARFSFLLSTPIIAGATGLHAKKALFGAGDYNIQLFAVGLIASFFTGIFAIKFLLRFLKKHSMNIFVYYRFILSAVIIALIWFRR